jgi:REP element-mobilizing transposase RayT
VKSPQLLDTRRGGIFHAWPKISRPPGLSRRGDHWQATGEPPAFVFPRSWPATAPRGQAPWSREAGLFARPPGLSRRGDHWQATMRASFSNLPPMPEPLYTAANCRVAYQLHWSVTVFARQALPNREAWREQLQSTVERDGIRLLEFQLREAATAQWFVSSKPEVSPTQIVRSVKGRLQFLVKDAIPQLWRRHYSITSVGDATNDVLQGYVGRQVQRHPMADPRVVDRLVQVQFHDPTVDLAALRDSTHGRFIHSLHLVLENAEHLCDTREEWLRASRDMAIAACRKKGWLLSRLGLVGNHLHALVGCDVSDVPRDVALSLMNNLAFAHGMKLVYEPSFYVGTFGPYDHGAIRRVAGQ